MEIVPDNTVYQFNLLTKDVEQLILLCRKLQEENQLLRKRQDTLVADRAKLIEKNEQTRQRLEAMIQRLKLMENAG